MENSGRFGRCFAVRKSRRFRPGISSGPARRKRENWGHVPTMYRPCRAPSRRGERRGARRKFGAVRRPAYGRYAECPHGGTVGWNERRRENICGTMAVEAHPGKERVGHRLMRSFSGWAGRRGIQGGTGREAVGSPLASTAHGTAQRDRAPPQAVRWAMLALMRDLGDLQCFDLGDFCFFCRVKMMRVHAKMGDTCMRKRSAMRDILWKTHALIL